jgi:hypothetical protein
MRKAIVLSTWLAMAAGLLHPAAGRAAALANHTTTDPSTIPSSALDAARALSMSFSHASVGANLWSGLGLLAGDDSTRYAFPGWTENNRGNPTWQEKVDDFETWVAAHASGTQVFLNKLCYIDQDAEFAYYQDSMVKLAGQYPTRTFVWFTMPLMSSGSDNAKRASFNASVRAYAISNALPLFDIAAIESHAPDGSAVTSGGYEALYGGYTTDGGHLNEAGQRRVAGAMWHLMARVGGWSSGTGPVCGNGTCEVGETEASCAADCSGDPSVSGSSGCSSGAAGTSGLGAAALAALLSFARRRRPRLEG